MNMSAGQAVEASKTQRRCASRDLTAIGSHGADSNPGGPQGVPGEDRSVQGEIHGQRKVHLQVRVCVFLYL